MSRPPAGEPRESGESPSERAGFVVPGAKNPRRIAAGRIGARNRWGDTPRVVRLDDLTAPQRRLVLALIEAAKSERAQEQAAA
jgi:hypothetical protein